MPASEQITYWLGDSGLSTGYDLCAVSCTATQAGIAATKSYSSKLTMNGDGAGIRPVVTLNSNVGFVKRDVKGYWNIEIVE